MSDRPIPALDVDDVTRCPIAPTCAACGRPDPTRAVATLDTPVGTCCATLCDPCVEAGALPRFPSWGAAILAVGEHCTHLGCDVDEAAAAREAGR